MNCPECKGSGKVELFTSVEPCATCGGTGELRAVPVAMEGPRLTGGTPIQLTPHPCGVGFLGIALEDAPKGEPCRVLLNSAILEFAITDFQDVHYFDGNGNPISAADARPLVEHGLMEFDTSPDGGLTARFRPAVPANGGPE